MQDLLGIMSDIYQTYYLSICTCFWMMTQALAFLTLRFLVASRAIPVPTIIGLFDVPLPYFLSTPPVLAGLLASIAIFLLLVAHQQHHKRNHVRFVPKVAAIIGSPFTLADAMKTVAKQSQASEATALS